MKKMNKMNNKMHNKLLIVRFEMLKLIEDLDVPGMIRDEPVSWEKIHMVSSACIGFELAVTRGIDPVIASTACTLHDVGRVYTGKQQDHARIGYGYAVEFLTNLNLKYIEECDENASVQALMFTKNEITDIAIAVSEHSNKGEKGAPLCEIVKDADVLDMYYYGRELPRPEQRNRLEAMLSI